MLTPHVKDSNRKDELKRQAEDRKKAESGQAPKRPDHPKGK